MHYRHTLEFENNAELSAIHMADGKIVVRIRTDSPDEIPYAITKNHLYPLYCSEDNGYCRVSVGKTMIPVNRKLWKMIEKIDRNGEYRLTTSIEGSAEEVTAKINAVLECAGLKHRVVYENSCLKSVFIGSSSEI